MKKTISFGKIDYTGNGQESNLVEVEIEIREKGGEKIYKGEEKPRYNELSIRGYIWNTRHSDILTGGQCLNEIAEYIKKPLFTEIYEYWKKYHLNGIKADCEHQRADIDFQNQKNENIIVYKWLHLKDELSKEKKEVNNFIKTAIENNGKVELNETQQFLYNLQDCVYNHIGEYDKKLYKHKESDIEYKTCGWTRVDQHEKGLLLKPCPVCGYKYGSSWLHEDLPKEVENRIKEIINSEEC